MADNLDSTPVPEITRPMIESEIERLISILDWLDPDPDFEDGGEDDEDGGDAEPLYGWTGMQSGNGRYGPYGVETDALELDDADDEPELGSLGHMHQGSWAKSRDGEPSLGSLDFPFSQERWSDGRTDDREDDCEDEAAQCEDEGAQCDDEGVEGSEPVGAEDWAYPDVLWADHAEVRRRQTVRL